MSEPARQPSSRRTVLRGAAWTAPAIVLATAAPSYAASGAASVLQTASGRVDGAGLTMTTTIDFLNTNTGSTPASASVRLSSTAGQFGASDPTAVSPGWSFVSVTPVGSAAIRTYTFSGVIPGADSPSSTQPSTLRFTVEVEPAVGGLVNGNIQATTTVAEPATVTPATATGRWQ